MRPYYLLLLLCLHFSCQNTDKNGVVSPPITDSIATRPDSATLLRQTQGSPILLVVSTQQALIRKAPLLTAPELLRVQKGDSLVYSNMVSDFRNKIFIDGIEHDEPWLRVALEGNQMGWIYGGCVRFDGLSHLELAELVFDQRLRQTFGSNTATSLIAYQQHSRDMGTLSSFDLAFSESESLRESLEAKIEQQLSFLDTAQATPDFFWLNGAFNGFVTAYFADNNRYELFRDFRFWAAQAARSPEPADDSLVAVFLTAYASDSIEFVYGDWQYQIPDDGVYSRLGDGIHFNIINKINHVASTNPTYLNYLRPLLRQVLDDISLSQNYWRPLPQILAEIDRILSSNLPVVNSSMRIELKARRQMIQKFKENGIRVNAFEG